MMNDEPKIKTVGTRKSGGRFLSGVAVLTVSNVIVKLIGLLYKIPMIKFLGEEGMGYFNSAYELYTFFYIIATAGLPVAISIMIAKSLEKGNVANVKKIYKVTLAILILIGALGTLVLYYGAELFGELIGNTNAVGCIAAIAPMATFICVASAVRGFFQGHQNMIPTAVSQIIEALGKLLLGLVLAIWSVKEGYSIPTAAAFATAGITAGVGLSMLYLLLSRAFFRWKSGEENASEGVEGSKSILSTLFKIAVPITVSSTVISLTRVIDLVMIMRRLQTIGYTMGAANAIYGSYSTLAVSMFNFPAAFVTPIAVSLVPVLTAAVQAKDGVREKRVLNSSLRLCGLITLPASLGLSVFSRPILELVFSGETGAINISAPLLSVLGMSVFFSCIMTVTNSVLQAYGCEKKPIISMIIGAVVKVLSAYILIGIPKINIYGAPISTFLCAATVSLINLSYINKATDKMSNVVKLFGRALICSVTAIGAAGFGYYFTVGKLGESHLLTLTFIALAAAIYGVLSLKIRAVTEDDILMLPAGEKINKILRKVKLI